MQYWVLCCRLRSGGWLTVQCPLRGVVSAVCLACPGKEERARSPCRSSFGGVAEGSVNVVSFCYPPPPFAIVRTTPMSEQQEVLFPRLLEPGNLGRAVPGCLCSSFSCSGAGDDVLRMPSTVLPLFAPPFSARLRCTSIDLAVWASMMHCFAACAFSWSAQTTLSLEQQDVLFLS